MATAVIYSHVNTSLLLNGLGWLKSRMFCGENSVGPGRQPVFDHGQLCPMIVTEVCCASFFGQRVFSSTAHPASPLIPSDNQDTRKLLITAIIIVSRKSSQ